MCGARIDGCIEPAIPERKVLIGKAELFCFCLFFRIHLVSKIWYSILGYRWNYGRHREKFVQKIKSV
jgi:hypothetical protein